MTNPSVTSPCPERRESTSIWRSIAITKALRTLASVTFFVLKNVISFVMGSVQEAV